MPRFTLQLLLAFGWITCSYADIKPEVAEISIKIADAGHRMDREALDQLTTSTIQTRGVTDADSYGKLLSSVAYAWGHYASKDRTAISNAYHMRRIAREAQLDVGFNDNTTVTQFERVTWRPEFYSTAVDERSFAVARLEETDLWLRYWRKLEDAHAAVMASGRPPQTASSQATDPEERQRYLTEVIALNYWSVVRRDRPTFARWTIPQLGAAYTRDPVDFDELRGLVEHHLKGSGVTNAWESIVTSLPPQFRAQAAAAYAKPYEAKPRKSLLPAVAPPPTREPVTSAVARPNKTVEAMRRQQNAPVPGAGVAGDGAGSSAGAKQPGGVLAEAEGGGAVWPWAGLALVVLAGGWVWLRQRS